jgi:hypothetical protein
MTDPTPNKFAVQGRTKLINGTILMPEMGGLRLILVPASENGKPDTEMYNLLDKKWKVAKAELKGWNQYHVDFKLGNLHTTAVNSDIWLIHALFLKADGTVDDKAFASCLTKLEKMSKDEKASVHVSVGVAETVPNLQELMQKALVEKGVSVYYYAEPTAQ